MALEAAEETYYQANVLPIPPLTWKQAALQELPAGGGCDRLGQVGKYPQLRAPQRVVRCASSDRLDRADRPRAYLYSLEFGGRMNQYGPLDGLQGTG